jgi:DNA-binding GntR family transcriptional regulator
MATPRQVDDDPGQISVTLHDRLRDAILSGELPAGAVMSQVELAREFEVSRTPLREAMRMLQREGLIEAEANRRVRVTPISLEDLEELYSLRIVTEALGVRLSVPRLTAEDDAFLDLAIAETNRYSAEIDFVMKDRWHRAFHDRLAQHAGARVVAFLRDLRDHAGRYRRMYVASHDEAWTVAVMEHDLILQAAHDRNAELTAGLMARHLARTALSVIGTIAPEHEPADIRTALRTVLEPTPSQDVFPSMDR